MDTIIILTLQVSSKRKDKENDEFIQLKSDRSMIQLDKSMLPIPMPQMLCVLGIGEEVKDAITEVHI